jgi:hypothetical protein
MWRLNGFKTHIIDPNIVRLQIHLPDQQIITYIQGQERTALAAAAFKHIMLTSYFLIVTSEYVLPLILLHNVKGAMSFEHLKYVNNIQC